MTEEWSITQPPSFVFQIWSIEFWHDSSTTGLHLPKLSLAVMVLIEDVNTTLFTVFVFWQALRRFNVPLIAGSMIFDLTNTSSSSNKEEISGTSKNRLHDCSWYWEVVSKWGLPMFSLAMTLNSIEAATWYTPWQPFTASSKLPSSSKSALNNLNRSQLLHEWKICTAFSAFSRRWHPIKHKGAQEFWDFGVPSWLQFSDLHK